jgi:methionine-rich copper-binding protein CopC
MMVTAAGEQTSYSIPLPELEPGLHEVRWRVLASGVSQEGRLSFTVR